ncbi:hypothetical protein [Suipraeoptans intestinalis]|uniref:Uncharacterized protein n=1 Tax=Suipraeoptans intestinalis TaxID=2606628 RepID=A0A6N7UTV7_9FIRM|nr:hypothetical protein [Suipraeoptans intestinalis]MDD7771013.1 hypothetical protein [Suipraeoptans intestinalis]MDY3121841.1 hypothetical protein [Suipraeoptans intestinalis]MSR94664.1 hypothetical protein [Suipraeoptans intestinalis]
MKKVVKWVVCAMLVLLLCFSFVGLFGFIKGCISKNLVQAFCSAYNSIFCVLLFFIAYNMVKINDVFKNMNIQALTKKVRVTGRLLIVMSVVEFIFYNVKIENGIGLSSFHINYIIVICVIMYVFLQSMLEYISKKES